MPVTPRSIALVCILTSILFAGPAASAAVETFQLQWASYDFYTTPTWKNATTTASLEPWVAPDGSGTGYHLYGPSGVGSEQFDFYFRCGSGNPEPCAVASNFSFPYAGSLSVERDYPEPGAAYITLDITWTGHSSGRLIAVGTKQQAAPPPPSAIKVFITQPHNGDTVSGTSWVVIWAEGASGSSNVYTLTVDNTVVFTQNAGGSLGPVSMPWNTKAFLNGTHTVTATVKDATGATGSGSISVLVNNP